MQRPAPFALLWIAAVVLSAIVAFIAVLTDDHQASASPSEHPITLPIHPDHVDRVHWTDTWGAPRSGGRLHIGVDIMGPKRIPLVAAADSEVTWGRFNNGRGSIVRLRDASGWEYQYIHINNDTPGTDNGSATCLQSLAPKLCQTMDSDGDLRRGVTFEAGELVGYLGDAGNAEWTAPHLHFEIYRPDGSGGVSPVNPTPYVDAALERLRSGGGDTGPVGPFTSAGAAADEMITRLEGRPPTWAERQSVVVAIGDGDLAAGLAEIVEGNPTAAMIDRLYLAFFLRVPDEEGLRNWIEVRGDGQRLEDIADWFAQSAEFEARYDGTDFGQFIDQLYVEVLDRPSDPGGRAYWLEQLQDGEVTRGTIVVYFSESDELRTAAAYRNELTVVRRALGQNRPTDAEVDAWANLRSTTSLEDAIETQLGD